MEKTGKKETSAWKLELPSGKFMYAKSSSEAAEIVQFIGSLGGTVFMEGVKVSPAELELHDNFK